MNPLRWVRWKVVIALAVLGGIAYFLGLDSVALSQVNSAGKESRAARWSVKDLALGLLGGDARFDDILVATPKGSAAATSAAGKDNVFNAAQATVDISMTSLLERRYVVDQVAVKAPKLTVTRREDGTINIGEIGGAPPETAPQPPEESKDWLGAIKKWYERVQKIREKLPKGDKKETGEKKPGVDYSRGVTYPFEGRPTVAVREIKGENFEIDFHDESRQEPLPSLKKGTIIISEVTSSPSVQEKPTTLELSGEIAGAPLKVTGTVDLRGERSLFQLDTVTGDLPVELIEAFVGPSLPVKLKSGTLGLKAKVLLDGPEKMEVAPSLSFKKILLDPKDPRGKIAGLEASQFTTAFNEASKELDALVIEDLKITGSLRSPRFEWGDTVKNLVVSGGKAFAQKQAQKGLEKGKEVLQKELDKTPLGGQLKDKLKDKNIKDLQKGLDGIFGGKEKK
jgi:hypothetical protein